MAGSLFKKTHLRIEQQSNEIEQEQNEDADDNNDIDKDIEEQLLQLNEQQRKEAKRFENSNMNFRLFILGFVCLENVNM